MYVSSAAVDGQVGGVGERDGVAGGEECHQKKNGREKGKRRPGREAVGKMKNRIDIEQILF